MFLFAFVWIYQGIVPKLLFTHLEEVKMLSVLIGSNESSICILKIIGMLEIIFRRMAVANNKTKIIYTAYYCITSFNVSSRIYEYCKLYRAV